MTEITQINLEKWHQVSKEHFSKITPHYDQGRDFEGRQPWMEQINRHTSIGKDDWVLDAGSGTGLLAVQFAGQIMGRMLGLEPSRAMLQQALQKTQPANLDWLQGISETLPLANNTLKAVFLSQVWHHLQDQNQAGREFFRCLKPGGGLFIKTYSHAQIQARWDLQCIFPELMPLMLGIYPDIADYEALLKNIGFDSVSFQSTSRENFMLPSQMLTILREKAWSMFSFLSPEGAVEGAARLEALIAGGDAPVLFPEVHLLVIALK
jgi:ubiquinone/menaquinone biosynthesis C-methylase UbiE